MSRFALIAAGVFAASPAAAFASAAHPPTAAASSPKKTADSIAQQWRTSLRASAAVDPNTRFINLPRQTLLTRLQAASARYHFDVVSVRFLRPRQLAPVVIVTSSNERALASATRMILRSIDPKALTKDDRTGWAYEGFFLEARNQDGVPFLVVFNHWRGPHAGGGQWAASESLYPLAHG